MVIPESKTTIICVKVPRWQIHYSFKFNMFAIFIFDPNILIYKFGFNHCSEKNIKKLVFWIVNLG